MRILSPKLLFGALLPLLLVTGLCAQREPGKHYFGTHSYVEYQAGNLPIVLTAPHGGYLKPKALKNRTWGVIGQDLKTQELARDLSQAIFAMTGRYPHVIINRLHRVKLDANRAIKEAAQGDKGAEQAWREFHAYIDEAKKAVVNEYGKGHLYDLHGHGHATPWLELGYALTASDLAKSDKTLRQQSYIAKSTIRNLAVQKGVDFPEVLRGPSSLGGLLYKWYRSVPGPIDPSPNGKAYFNGGYNVRRHGSQQGGAIDATQIEHHNAVRLTSSARQAYSVIFSKALLQFFRRYYAIDLASGARPLGPGCPGTQGTPRYSTPGSIAIGAPARIHVDRLPAASPTLLVIGVSAKSWGAFGLPLDLSPLGAKNCFLRQGFDLGLSLGTATGGSIQRTLPIPRQESLKGRSLYSSVLVFDPKANKLGLTFSNALVWRIGQL